MGEPFGKASGRTFHLVSTHVYDTFHSSPQVQSYFSPKASGQPPSEALENGLSMSVCAPLSRTFLCELYS
jgi:hypothetical protein